MSTDHPPPKPKRNSPSGARKITKEKYQALLAAFREHGDNFKAVAEEVGVHWSTAKKAWTEGWSSQKSKPWALPIEQVIAKEQVEARAALARERQSLVEDHRIARQKSLQEAIEHAFDDLVDSRSKQGKVIRGARDNSLAALIITQKLLRAAMPLADKIVKQLESEQLNVFERMRLLRQLGRFSHDAIEMAQAVEEMEAKALGEPEKLLEVQHTFSMDPSEARATLGELADVLGLYEKGTIDDVIDVTWDESESEDDSGKGGVDDADSPEDRVPEVRDD